MGEKAFAKMDKMRQVSSIMHFIKKYTKAFETTKAPINDIYELFRYNAKKLEEAGFNVDFDDQTVSL